MNATPLPAGSLRATSLNAGRRADELANVADSGPVDLLVVGGGVIGAGVALDAAARGLSVVLIEADDLAWGTSRSSSKLVHGGLRHLTHGDFAMARLSAVERNVLMTRTAPHLVRTLPQLLPLNHRVSRRREVVYAAGFRTGDALRRGARTPSSILPPPRRVPAAEAVALVPGLRSGGLRGALLSFDGQLVDDARLVVALARTAAGFGARVLTRIRARRLDRFGADAVDQRSGESFRIRARSVVNATGVWAGELAPDVRLNFARGTHLVVDADKAGLAATALICPLNESPARDLLLLPQGNGLAYLGVTNEPVRGSAQSTPDIPQSDVDFLLSAARDMLQKPLGNEHVLGSFAGLRPLPARQRSKLLPTASDLSRHELRTSLEGVVTVVGGKLTTYRRIAAEAVDAAINASGLPAGPSRTTAVPLVGAAPRNHLTGLEAEPRLVSKYGTEAVRLTALAELDRDLADAVAPGLTAVEVLWAVRHEGALDADDVLDRRSRVGLNPAERENARTAVTEVVQRALEGVLA